MWKFPFFFGGDSARGRCWWLSWRLGGLGELRDFPLTDPSLVLTLERFEGPSVGTEIIITNLLQLIIIKKEFKLMPKTTF